MADDESAMRILVMGDFGGRMREPAMIDVDNFDRAIARAGPRLQLPLPGHGEVALEFSSIDDFHPDALYRRLPLFQRLRNTRIEPDPETFARLVGGTPTPAAQRSPGGGAEHRYVQALLQEAVQPHVVPDAPAHQAVYAAAVDAAIGDAMRAILQDAQFKALEALWRGVHWLASHLETDEQLKLYVLDASREALPADLETLERTIESSGPWSLIVGNYSFGLAEEDLALLAKLAAVAAQAGGPFLAEASPELLGCRSLAATPDPRDWTPPGAEAAERWSALRKSALAPWIGLALPRMLLRLPYGKSGDPVESFAFEELSPQRSHESYLWGNGALACAQLIGRAFTARGWDMEPGDELELDDLPAHTYDDDGEKRLQACAEAALPDRAAQAILDAGLIPLLSRKDRNAVRVMRFQSVAAPAQPLEGPWG